MSVGGWLADRLARTNPRALFVVPGLAMLASIPFVLLALFAAVEPWVFAGIFLAETLMFMNTGPCNAVIANVVAPNMRAAAFAVAVLAIHFLGDIWSPFLMGEVADLFGDPTPWRAASAGRSPPSAPCRRRGPDGRPRTCGRAADRRAGRGCSPGSSSSPGPATCPARWP